MTLPIAAVHNALGQLLAQPVGEHTYSPQDFTDAVWNFLHAFVAVRGGRKLLDRYSHYLADVTTEGTSYARAVKQAQLKIRRIKSPESLRVRGRELLSPLACLKKSKLERAVPDVIIAERDRIRAVLYDFSQSAPSLSKGQREALRHWYDECVAILAYCNNHHIESCQWLWAMLTQKSASWEHGLLGVDLGRFNALEIQECAKSLVSEIEAAPFTENAARRPYQFTEVDGASEVTIPTKRKVFIGHGRSPVWKELRDFLRDKLRIECDEFNNVETAGMSTKERLEEMLSGACFAFLVLTGEDDHADGKVHARENVIHEVGLFQGRLGFMKAIILLENECEQFSNIVGITQIRFPKDNIMSVSERIRDVLAREEIPGSGQTLLATTGGGVKSESELSREQVIYLMTLSRPRNRQGIGLRYFDEFPDSNSERYYEMVRKFCSSGLMRIGSHSFILTIDGYRQADFFWRLLLLRELESLQAGREDFIETDVLATAAKLSQTDERPEVQRYLAELAEKGLIDPVKGDNGYLASRMTPKGRANLRAYVDLDFSDLKL